MKKILTLLLVLVLAFVFVGCDKIPGLDQIKIPGLPDLFPDDNTGDGNTGDEVDADLQAAYDYVHQITKTIAEKTGSNYTLILNAPIGSKNFSVTWEILGTDQVVIDGNTVVVPEPTADINYTLKFTVTNEKGETLSKEYKHVVPKFAFNTFAEYAAAADDEALVVCGVVTGVFSKTTGSSANGLYIQDLNDEGGYYVYNLTDDPNGVILPGMTVKVKGIKDTYNGTYELINATVEIVDETIKTVEPVDYTALLNGAAALDAADLVAKQGMLVTVKDVTILEAGDNGYYYFQLGAHKTYLRISSSNNATSTEALDAIKALHGENYGNLADVTGVISIYSGKFYLSPVSADAFSNVRVPERTDAEKVDMELGALKVEGTVTTDSVLTLTVKGTNFEDVVISWTSDNDAIVIDGANATVTVPNETVVVKLTATATCGDASNSKVFEVKLSKSLTTIPAATEIGVANPNYTAEKYLIAGIITSLYGKEESALKYGNVVITDELGNSIIVYGLYNADGTVRYDALEAKPAVGDYIVVLGILGAYNGTAQMKNGWIVDHAAETSISEANKIGAANPNYDTGKYMVSGVISALYGKEESALKYGNVIIKDADGNEIIVYGLYSSTGANRYDAMTVKPAVGDTITVYGVLGAYNGTAQMKNGWLIAHTAASNDDGGNQGGNEGGNTDTTNQNKADVTFADLGWENSKQYTSYDIDANITATTSGTAVGSYGLNTGKYYTAGNGWRIYQAESAQLTITAKNGATIVSVKVTYTVDKTGILTKDGANVESDAVVTVNGTSVTFGVGNTGTATNGQVRISAIEVLYTGGTPVEPKPETPAHTCVDANNDYKCDSADCNKAVAPAADSTLTIPQAIALANALGANQYTTNKYYITATIVDVYNDQYGNMNVKDADGNTYVFYGAYVLPA